MGKPRRLLLVSSALQTAAVEDFSAHRWGARCLDLTPDGSLAVSGGRSPGDADYLVINGAKAGYGCEVIVWNPRTREPIATTYVLDHSVAAVAISPDGTRIAAADTSGHHVYFELKR